MTTGENKMSDAFVIHDYFSDWIEIKEKLKRDYKVDYPVSRINGKYTVYLNRDGESVYVDYITKEIFMKKDRKQEKLKAWEELTDQFEFTYNFWKNIVPRLKKYYKVYHINTVGRCGKYRIFINEKGKEVWVDIGTEEIFMKKYKKSDPFNS